MYRMSESQAFSAIKKGLAVVLFVFIHERKYQTWMTTVRLLDWVCLHEQAARCRHGPLLSPARALKGITEGALPQHGSYQDLKHS